MRLAKRPSALLFCTAKPDLYASLCSKAYLAAFLPVKCCLAALNTKQQKDVVNGKITMGFVPYLVQVLWGYVM